MPESIQSKPSNSWVAVCPVYVHQDSDLRAPTRDELSVIHQKQGFLIDMDGVIYHGQKLLSGAKVHQ